jgi:hypothetical protein
MSRIVSLLLLALPLFAQEYRSTLTGQVTDPSKAAVSGVKVVLTKTDTNSRSETITGADGTYTVPFLPPGVYRMSVEAAGFNKFVRQGIIVAAGERVAADAQLEIKASVETVTVAAEAPELDTVSASSGQVISEKEIENLPMDGRSPLALARMAFGVISAENKDTAKPFENAGVSNFSMGGAAKGSNELLLNGVPNMGTGSRREAFSPPVDSVSEVKVEVFQTDASYGNTGGGTVNLITKSGTNAFHGSAYNFNETSALAANSFFNNKTGTAKTVTAQNQYGGSVGGPVLLPKVFNGKDKVFFFFAYEGFKGRTPSSSYTAVPTAAERTGDFSALLALNTSSKDYTLYDPATGALSGSKVTRTAFPNNVIPASRLSAVAKNYLSFFPAPNQTGKSDGSQNFYASVPSTDNMTSWTGRMDVNLSNRNKLSFDLHTNDYVQSSSDAFRNAATGKKVTRLNWGGMVDDVHTLTPTLVLDTRFGFSRFVSGNLISGMGYDPTQLGFPSYMGANAALMQMPAIAFGDGYNALAGGAQQAQPLDVYQLFTSLSKIVGSHSLKVGADIRMQRVSQSDTSGSDGTFTFDSTWVKASSTASAVAYGGSLASFMLGLPSSGSYLYNTPYTSQNYYFATFLQDDWRARHNLTLSFGLRYEHSTPTFERWDRQSIGMDLNAVNSVTASSAAAYAAKPIAQLSASAFKATGGYLFASKSQRMAYDTPDKSFSPRFGISWTPDRLGGKTVLRAGTGIFYYSPGLKPGGQPGFDYTNTFLPTNDSYLTPYATLSNPFPTGIKQADPSSRNIDTDLGTSVSFTNPTLESQYSIRWNVDIQQQLPHGMVLQVGYTGNHSVHLATDNAVLSLSPVVPYLSRKATRDQATIDALGAVVSNPFSGLLSGSSLNGTTTTVSKLLQAYPEYTSVTEGSVNGGGSYFHMVAVRLQKRFSNGLQFQANYQHSRLMEAISLLNSGDNVLEKRVSDSDRPNRLALSGTYDLPFGKGRHYLSKMNPVLDAVLGGWGLAGSYTLMSGQLISWGNLIYYGGDLNYDVRNIGNAFDTTRFNVKSAEQLANNYRTFPSRFNNTRSDRLNTAMMSAIKSFRLGEKVALQYRFETFNTFNHVVFAAPSTSATSSAFGTVTSQSNSPRAVQMALRLRF